MITLIGKIRCDSIYSKKTRNTFVSNIGIGDILEISVTLLDNPNYVFVINQSDNNAIHIKRRIFNSYLSNINYTEL